MKSLLLAITATAGIFYCLQRPTLRRLLSVRRRPVSTVRPLASAPRKRRRRS